MKEKHQAYLNRRIAVPGEFEEVFSHFYYAVNQSDQTVTKTLLPSYQTIMVFNFGAKALLHSPQNTHIEMGRCLVLGPIKQAFAYSLPVASEILVVNFKNDAFFRFFGVAAVRESLPVNPDELSEENCFTALWYELNKIENTSDRVNRILAFCRPYLGEQNSIVKQLSGFENNLLNPVKTIAYQNKQSERNIQLRHKMHLGYSAKELSRYQRFLTAIEHVQHMASTASKVDWLEIVSRCNYYDQSQLIRDFKYYLNLSPTNYLKFQQDICNPKS
ncbi:helix-turn-helix domain-containing protein [Rapidithrix thailandica]|uniref:Helix-turn-helix domain-containing protein n=1 Tax=Rapidithrix thailandica TaxID=413964 RepID=A0AAW9SKQ6_9BACT